MATPRSAVTWRGMRTVTVSLAGGFLDFLVVRRWGWLLAVAALVGWVLVAAVGADAGAADASFFFDVALAVSDTAEAPPLGGTAGTEETAMASSVVMAMDRTNAAPRCRSRCGIRLCRYPPAGLLGLAAAAGACMHAERSSSSRQSASRPHAVQMLLLIRTLTYGQAVYALMTWIETMNPFIFFIAFRCIHSSRLQR